MMREFCFKHQTLRPAGEACARCAVEVGAAEQRDALSIVLGMVDDQGQEIVNLRRQVIELRRIVLDVQRVHNATAAHVRPNEDLLP
jgi:hypothetical protein